MFDDSVRKFEDGVLTILGEMRIGQCSDVSGIGMRPEDEDDVRRISAALLPLLQNLAQTKHLWVSDSNIISGRREASAKMFLDENGDIVLPR